MTEFLKPTLINLKSNFDERGNTSLFEFNDFALGQKSKLRLLHVKNILAGTIRGLHYQELSNHETKFIICESGKLFDVSVCIDPNSPFFGTKYIFELDSNFPQILHVPTGYAHGYQTLEGNTNILYFITGDHNELSGRTLLWNDKSLNIPWPMTVTNISNKDSMGDPWEKLIF